ncbi:unnamed protein product [Urochloa decumbens]|uniref:Major facilitator superfamily (MFS) profile domain-containing protein n=1 Tax=Urochloa decumbens TaxID=240449 RepID=A0ABC9AJE6_9POAL
MTTILMGYNLAVMSGAQLFMREDVGLTDVQVEVLSGSMNVFMLVSILAGGWCADVLGRRRTLVLANAFLMAGALAMSLGRSYAALMAARFVTSVGAGFARVVAPVYNAEISPPSTRGVLSSLLDVFINVGILLSYVSNYAFAGLPAHLGWRVMFAAGALPPVFLAAGVFAIMPESPRWLVMRGRHGEAHAVLARTSGTTAEADLRLEEIKLHAVSSSAAPAAKSGGAVRRVLVCVAGLQFFQQASGIDAIVLYSPLVFKNAGMSSNAAVLGATVGASAWSRRASSSWRRFSPPASAGGRSSSPAPRGPGALRRQRRRRSRRHGGVRRGGAGIRGGVLGRARAGGAHVQLGDRAAAAARAGHELRHGGEQGGVRGGVHDVHLSGWLDHHARVLVYSGVAAAACAFVYVHVPETSGRSLEDMDVLFVAK